MKIAIIGNAGSGKSTLALTLHKIFRIPLYHLDQYFWKPGWIEPERIEFEKIHKALCDKPTWIIEGMAIRFFEYRMQKADIVIYLNMPSYKCLYRVLSRVFRFYGKEFFSSAPGCPERKPDWKFLKFISTFNSRRRPIIQELLKKYANQKKIFVVKNQKNLEEIVKKFESNSF